MQEWMRQAANNAPGSSSVKRTIMGPGDDHALAIVSSSSSSGASSSSSGSKAKLVDTKVLSKKGASQAEKSDVRREAILAFFKPKKA